MSNPTPNYLPPDPDDQNEEDMATREVDGETELDDDANPDLLDSADADRIASGGEDDL